MRVEVKGITTLRPRTRECVVTLRGRSGGATLHTAGPTIMEHAAMKPGEPHHRTRRGVVPALSSAAASPRFASVCALGCAASALLATRSARADGLTDDDLWRYRSTAIAVDGGVVAALPAALETGLAKGFGAGVAVGRDVSWGVRASWATATETTIGWNVTHDDVRLRLTGGMQATLGRGTLGVRLGLGGTLVHETRERIHGDIAGSQGMLRETTANALLPAADLDGVVSLHVTRGWMMILAGGPSLTRVDHEIRAGWTSYLGVAWQL